MQQYETAVWRWQFWCYVQPNEEKAAFWLSQLRYGAGQVLMRNYGLTATETDAAIKAVAGQYDPDSRRSFISCLCDYAEKQQRQMDTQAAALSAKAYQHNGLTAFKNSGASNPERIVIGK